MAYGKTADHKLYADKDYKVTVTMAEIKEAFLKGRLVIVEGENYLVPVGCSDTSVVTVTGSETATAQTWTASGEEE